MLDDVLIFLYRLKSLKVEHQWAQFRYLRNVFILVMGCSIISCTDKTISTSSLDPSIESYLSSAFKYQHTDPDSVIKYTDLVSRASTDRNYTQEVSYLRSSAYRYQGNLSEAIKALHNARNQINASEPDSLDGEILFVSAQLFTDIGQYDNAIVEYQKAIFIFDLLDYPIGIGKCLNSISLIYYRLDDLEKSQEYSDKALKIWKDNPYPLGSASSYTVNGYILSHKQQYDLAIVSLEKASALYKEIRDEARFANNLLNIGEVYLKRGDHNQAQKLFELSLDLSKDLNYRQIYVDGLNKLGQCFIHQKNYKLAEENLLAGLKEAKEIGDQALLGEFNYNLSILYDAVENHKKAYYFQYQYSLLKDEIFKSERNLRIAEYEVKYETEEISQQNRILEQKNRQRLIYIGFLISITLLILFLGLVIRSRYKIRLRYLNQEQTLQETNLTKQKLENEKLETEARLKQEENAKLHLELSHKQKELSNVTLYLYQKNENLNNLLDKVTQVEQSDDINSRKNLSILKRAIQSNLNLDQDWERFKTHFDKVHENFIDKLSQQYPILTALDLRHCAYIRMNLSTKEISRLINIAPASVQKSRVRLKKKLKLSKETDLFHFIRDF